MSDEKKGTIVDAFVEGARNGFKIATNSTIPSILFAFAMIQILEMTNLLALIGRLFQPIMMLFGLPGVAATVLMASLLSMGGGVGVAAGLITAGELTGNHIVIILPAIYLMGSLVQYIGRIAGTVDIKPKYYGHLIGISLINAALAMLVMRLFT